MEVGAVKISPHPQRVKLNGNRDVGNRDVAQKHQNRVYPFLKMC
jgi:hypothetical protein